MATINDNYLKLPGSYLFAEIARRVAAYKEAHPEADIIRLGIGDVTVPWPRLSSTPCTKPSTKWAKLKPSAATVRNRAMISFARPSSMATTRRAASTSN